MDKIAIHCLNKKEWAKVRIKIFSLGYRDLCTWSEDWCKDKCMVLREELDGDTKFIQYADSYYWEDEGYTIVSADKYLSDIPTKLSASKDKLRYDLLPIEAIEEVVRVFMYGAEKYEAWDWYKNPLPWSTYHNASYRHGMSMWRHEDIDVESGLHTLAHKIASDIILLTYQLKGIGEDDRI